MYDYVLQYGFDNNTQKTIQEVKESLKKNNIEDRERNWLPHITIDLYNCKNQDEFVKQLDKTVEEIGYFEIECKNLNNFDEKTLYFVAKIEYLWVYNCDMKLIKEYELKS